MINELTQTTTAIKTATVSTSPFSTVIANAGTVYNAAAFTPVAATTLPALLGNVINPLLPADATTTALYSAGKVLAPATDAASYLAQAALTTSTLTMAAGGTKNAYILQGKMGAANLTVTESAAGTAPFAGNGVVKESVVFTGTDKDVLTISSETSSVNVADNAFNGSTTNTEFGSSVDALNQNRSVAYTNLNHKIASAYQFSAKHAFNEDANGNQAFQDATSKVYNYNDPSIRIVSATKTAMNAATNFVSGAENLAKTANANYSYQDVATQGKTTALNYVVSQAKTSTTVSATTSETTITQLPKFALVKDGFTLNASGTIVHKQVFNDNGSVENSGNPSIIGVAPAAGTRTQTSDTYDVRTLKVAGGNADFAFNVVKFLDSTNPRLAATDNTPGSAANTDGKVLNIFNSLNLNIDGLYDQNFTASATAAASDQPTALRNAYISTTVITDDTFTGTRDNDNIKVLSTDATRKFFANGGSGNDLITGHNGVNGLDGQKGNDTLVGGLGADTLHGGLDADKFVIGNTDSGITVATADTIDDFKTTVDKLVLGTAAVQQTATNGLVANYVEATTAAAAVVAAGATPAKTAFEVATTAANAALATLATANTGDVEAYAFQFINTGTVAAPVNTGYLFNDTDGNGIADQVIVLTGGINAAGIAAADIIA